MDIFLTFLLMVALLVIIGLVTFEFRVRQPDMLVLYESNGKIALRTGTFYPRHFSLPLKRANSPVQLTVEASAAGNLGVNIKLVGSVTPTPEYVQTLVRIGGWNSEAVSRAAEEVSISLDRLVKEYAEKYEIRPVLVRAGGLLE